MTAFEPIIIDTSVEPDEGEQIHLFSIDGVDYGMPAEVPPSIAMQALNMMRDEHPGVASMWVLEEVLGTEAYEALINCRHVDKEQLGKITNAVNDHAFGALDESEGNGQGPNRAARRSVSRAGSSNGSNGGRGSSTTKATSTRTSGASTGSPRRTRKTS